MTNVAECKTAETSKRYIVNQNHRFQRVDHWHTTMTLAHAGTPKSVYMNGLPFRGFYIDFNESFTYYFSCGDLIPIAATKNKQLKTESNR